MTRQTDPSDWEARLRKLERDVRQALRQTQLANASVTRGQVRIASQEGLRVEGTGRVTGTLYIDGLEQVDGTLRVIGTLDINGPVDIAGNVTRSGNETATGNTTLNGLLTVNGDAIFNSSSQATFNGPVDIVGATDITGTLNTSGNTTIGGTLNVTGATTVSNDLDVTGGGTIQAGNVTITPANGGRVSIGSTTINSDGSITNVANTGLRINDATVTGMPTLTSVQIAAGAYPVWAATDGHLLLDRNNIAP